MLKEISVGDLQPDETVDAMHEANLLRNLDHPGIVRFHDSFIDQENFCIITEYCEVRTCSIFNDANFEESVSIKTFAFTSAIACQCCALWYAQALELCQRANMLSHRAATQRPLCL